MQWRVMWGNLILKMHGVGYVIGRKHLTVYQPYEPPFGVGGRPGEADRRLQARRDSYRNLFSEGPHGRR